MTDAKTIQANRTRVQKTKALHEQNSRQRASDISDLKAAYQAEKDGPVVTDILAKARVFAAYHQKLAQDGVGARKTGYKLENQTDEVENYFLGSEERLANLDKAAGIQELIDYIERQLKTDLPTPNPTLETAVADAEDGDIVADDWQKAR